MTLLILPISLFAGLISRHFGALKKFSLWSFKVIKAFLFAICSTLSSNLSLDAICFASESISSFAPSFAFLYCLYRISNHNKRILKESVATEKKPCNCRDTSNCPMNGRCNVKSIVHTATVTPQEPPPPSTVTDISMKQPENNVTTQQLSQTAANATNTTGSRKKRANKSKIMNYIGSCETTFKARFINHTHSFRNRNKSNATELSKYY